MPRSSSSPFAKSPVLACLLSLMVGDAAAADRQDRREVRQDAASRQIHRQKHDAQGR